MHHQMVPLDSPGCIRKLSKPSSFSNRMFSIKNSYGLLMALVLLTALVSLGPNVSYAAEQDCLIKNGVLTNIPDARADCTAPIATKETASFGLCDDQAAYVGRMRTWCEVKGGTFWVDTQGGFHCDGAGETTENKVLTYSQDFAEAIWNACGGTNVSDTGWGATISSYQCWSGSPGYPSGTRFTDFRRMDFSGDKTLESDGVTCSANAWSERVYARFDTDVQCETGYKARLDSNNEPECYRYLDFCPLQAGNPIQFYMGGKVQKEVDYPATSPNGVEIKRYYNSAGYHQPWPTIPDAEDYWRTSYDSRITEPDGSGDIMASLQTPDGWLKYFDASGQEIHQTSDKGNRLERLVDGADIFIGWRYTKSNGDVEIFNTEGKLTSITSRTGVVQTLEYNSLGQLARVFDSYGQELLFTYNAIGDIETITDPNQNVYHYGYDVDENLTTVTFPDETPADLSDNPVKTYLYNEQHLTNDNIFRYALTGIIDERGIRYATFAYDDSGRAVMTTHPNNVDRVAIEYNDDGTRIVTDSKNNTSTYTTEIRGGVAVVTQITGPGCESCGGGDSTTEYESGTNNILQKTENGVTTQWGNYDSNGNPGYKIESVGTPEQRRFDYTYDSRFAKRIATITEPSVKAIDPTVQCTPGVDCKVTTYTYDDFENRTSVTIDGYASDGQGGFVPVSRTTSYTYGGPFNQLTQIDGPRPNAEV
ncbi:MAG: DUF6531 domain-containing protein, partial [Gammaproteobacteria bacterium]